MSLASREHLRATAAVAAPFAALEMLAAGRRCSECNNPLSRYNKGPCEVCKQKNSREAAAVAGRPRFHILSMLSMAERTIPELAEAVEQSVWDTRSLVRQMVSDGLVEVGEFVFLAKGRKLRSYRLAVKA